MAAMTYLQKHPKSGVYRFRRWIPPELREALGKGAQYTATLHTKDCKEAKRRLAPIAARVQEEFDRAMQGGTVKASLTLEDAERLAAVWLVQELDSDASHRVHGIREGWIELTEAGMEEAEPYLRGALITGKFSVIDNEITWVLKQEGIAAAPGSDAYQSLGHALVRATLKLYDMQRDRNVGEWPAVPAAASAVATPAAVIGINPPLTEILDRWLAERQPSTQTEREWRAAIRRFTEVNGDLPVDAITKGHVREFKDALLKLPRHISNRLRGKPIPAILAATENKGGSGHDRVSPTTVNKTVGALSTVLNWAARNGYRDGNPASDFKVAVSKNATTRRLSYSPDDLTLLFQRSPVFTTQRTKHHGTAKYWLPLLALYTGARLEELGQLLVDDVREEGGVPYLDINADGGGKTVKTQSSDRTIPLHPELIRCGFLEHVAERRRAGDARVFPELKPDSKGKLTAQWSKWWGRYARDHGITDRRKVFHSLRHGFKDACRAAGIQEEVHDSITGHAGRSVGRSYGHAGVPIAVKAGAVAKVEYPGLDLSHLYGATQR